MNCRAVTQIMAAFWMDREVLKEVDRQARAAGLTRSEWFRKTIDRGLALEAPPEEPDKSVAAPEYRVLTEGTDPHGTGQ